LSRGTTFIENIKTLCEEEKEKEEEEDDAQGETNKQLLTVFVFISIFVELIFDSNVCT
jgi:hypothetical protein